MKAKLPRTCIKCGATLEVTAGPGRPPTYCSMACKRLVEIETRRLDKRIAAYEIEHRGLVYDGPDFPDDSERLKRMRALRRWIQTDEQRLRELLGGGQDRSNQSKRGAAS